MATPEKYSLLRQGYDNLVNILGTRCLGSPLLAIATTTDLIKTTRDVHYMIAGRTAFKAATDNIAWSPAASAQGPSQTRYYVVAIDISGTVTITQGDDGAGYPDRPANTCLLGIIKVVTNSSTTFTPDTTAWNAAGVTSTFRDYGIPPGGTPF